MLFWLPLILFFFVNAFILYLYNTYTFNTCLFCAAAILTIYLRNELGYSDDAATVVYHTFNMFCYFTPILGAILADTLLGKFK